MVKVTGFCAAVGTEIASVFEVHSADLTIRMISASEAASLKLPEKIRFCYVSEFFYDVEYRETPAGFGWSLIRRPASPPIRRENKWTPFEPHVEKPRGYVAFAGDSPVGYAEFSYIEHSKLVQVWHFYVKESERQKGIGRALMNEVEQAARHFQARGILLETQTSNCNAIAFYKKMGFEPWGLNTSSYTNTDIEDREVLLWLGKQS